MAVEPAKHFLYKNMGPAHGVVESQRRLLWMDAVVASLQHAPRASLAIELADDVIEAWDARFSQKKKL